MFLKNQIEVETQKCMDNVGTYIQTVRSSIPLDIALRKVTDQDPMHSKIKQKRQLVDFNSIQDTERLGRLVWSKQLCGIKWGKEERASKQWHVDGAC